MKPGAPLIFASLASLFLGAGAFFSPVLLFIWTIFCFILLPFIIIDGLLLFFWTDRLSVTRKINPVLSLGCPAPVNLTVTKTGKGMSPSGFSIFDIFDDSMNTETLPIIVKKSGFAVKTEGEGSIFEYQVTPFERGRWEFLSCELLLNSFLRFWRLKVTHRTKNSGLTYPDFSNIASEKSLRALLQDSGEKTLRRRGAGIEYLGLRDFQTGDSVRAIDWRATSRRQKPIVREYQDDQDQNVLLLLDSGYRLHRRDISAENDVLQFDCALSAALLLAYTVLKHGDSVSAGVFGNEERWLPPRKGKAAFPSLMNGLFDVQSAGSPSSPFAALENAVSKLKRRTLSL
ncbi:hypothetical protein AGMMS50212_07790 [Spirochaetia bacterium]|nr:hypothetical protein AGMMS50212_07790 [Spirochaetia bacterium]